jgi:hypothetical protein
LWDSDAEEAGGGHWVQGEWQSTDKKHDEWWDKKSSKKVLEASKRAPKDSGPTLSPNTQKRSDTKAKRREKAKSTRPKKKKAKGRGIKNKNGASGRSADQGGKRQKVSEKEVEDAEDGISEALMGTEAAAGEGTTVDSRPGTRPGTTVGASRPGTAASIQSESSRANVGPDIGINDEAYQVSHSHMFLILGQPVWPCDDDGDDDDEYTNLCLSAFCSFYSYTSHHTLSGYFER